jgi:Domain of unknown function (DUF3597)
MSVFANILEKILGSSKSTGSAPSSEHAPHTVPEQTPAPAGASSPVPPQQVDVAAVLDSAAAASGQELDWRKSIVDLMKALKLDSSLPARQELAKELHYTGDMHETAKMNVWLHVQVMRRLAENGGKLPEDLRA